MNPCIWFADLSPYQRLLDECQRRKWFLSSFLTIERLVSLSAVHKLTMIALNSAGAKTYHCQDLQFGTLQTSATLSAYSVCCS
jgi:hypothetical protein